MVTVENNNDMRRRADDGLEQDQKAIIERFIREGDIVLDTSLKIEDWGEYILQRIADVQLHRLDEENMSLDDYCRAKEIYRVNFLRVDERDQEFNVLLGAHQLIMKENIDYIQFRFTDTSPNSGAKLLQLLEDLQRHHYQIFLIQNHAALRIEKIVPSLSQFHNRYFLVVNGRLKRHVLGGPAEMFDLNVLCREHGIKPKGVIHIGAHEGKELANYLKMGYQKILFIEANPEVYQRLLDHIQGRDNVLAVNVAISDYDGMIELHVTNFDQSSSILPLKEHKDIYPGIQEAYQTKVPCRTLDQLLRDLELPPEDYNLLNIDIQGAELKALQGATQVLKNIDGINTEVNFAELYEGCALIHEIDEFLEKQGFQRVETTCPFHPSWGDAFYIRKK
ncbi:FkbM family methyltransferase [Desulfotomaculum sp. 1211_IL3151]|uniref:FkbM family methyltransferase n=1 Tax=Desulfotomaculum sp. 1211_IL3151 TaxID=3084055 RepID=UPI002FDAD4F7